MLCRDALASKQLLSGNTFALTKHSLCLMERIACAVSLLQPVLLVGETGNGKTAIVQHLAHQIGQKLIVQNMNQQTDSSDFLGGFKPVDLRTLCIPLMNVFGVLFPKTFSRANNKDFIAQVKKTFESKNWMLLCRLLSQSLTAAQRLFDQVSLFGVRWCCCSLVEVVVVIVVSHLFLLRKPQRPPRLPQVPWFWGSENLKHWCQNRARCRKEMETPPHNN